MQYLLLGNLAYSKVVVLLLLIIVAAIVSGGSVVGSCFVIHYFKSFALILMEKRELVALL